MLNHLAVIMDGNGRWANSRMLPRAAGHKKGAETARNLINSAKDAGIKYLTLYAFSSENWGRPAEEVNDLMNLLRFYLDKEIGNLHDSGIKIRIIGDLEKLSDDIRQKISKAEKLTENNSDLNLNIALSYGSRHEIVSAAKKLAEDIAAGKIKDEDVNEKSFQGYLYTAGIPDPDLLIRTGGDQRISNFLLWQSAYTEFYFTPVLWPDFSEKELAAAIEEFYKRERRFGGTKEKKASAV